MKKIQFSLIVLGLAFAIGCGGSKKEETKKINLTGEIKKAEAKNDINKPLNKENLLLLIDLYKQFADSLPKDPKSPVYMLRSCDFYGTLQMQKEKCELYRTILEKYPDFKDADMVMYLLASAYDSDLNNRVDAKKYYEAYIEKYPNSIYVPDAKARLTTIDSLSFKELQDMIIHQELDKSK